VALDLFGGKEARTDFLVDYASLRALRDGHDPYGISADLIHAVGGPDWTVETADPHPPTLLALMLPFALLPYGHSLAAWSMAMVFAYVLTLYFVGVRSSLAIPFGIAVALTFPGTSGLANPVPLIALGIAVAYRYRNNSIVAGIGLALATAPKLSGCVLLIPFLLTQRWRAVGWAAIFVAAFACLPILLYSKSWSRYFDAGVGAIRFNLHRADNASLLNLADKIGVTSNAALLILALVAILLGIVLRDLFWPTAWFMVAALPIAWMYSLLTLMPIAAVSLRRRSTIATGALVLAVGLSVGSPQLGMWPVWLVPIILALSVLVMTGIVETEFWPARSRLGRLLEELRALPARAL
jgi:hypothetical protein